MRLLLTILCHGLLVLPAFADDAMLPPPAKTKVDFTKHIRPILKAHCVKCHAGEKRKGGFSLNTRKTILDGSESDTVVLVGKSAKSALIHRVAETDPDLRMPPKGETPLTKAQVGLLRAWIDQGMKWPEEFAFGRLHRQAELAPRKVELPKVAGVSHPIDRLLHPYFAKHGVKTGSLVSDRVFARRVWLDLVGLLPPVDEVEAFVKDSRSGKHARLVDRLLNDRKAYAAHWMTWWSDLLRNDYRGTGYIDGGRKQITGWLYKSLHDNKPYDEFVTDLMTGANGAGGFLWGIQWRGTVNDSQRREMQAAQNVAQVFLGTNLKCASCHDSFVNHWKLKQAYAFASVFANKPLELHRCDKPTGKMADVAFLYPSLGSIDPKSSVKARRQRLAEIITSRKNGRFTRTIVNRLWARFFGAGIVEPLDDMDQKPWNQDLLDWLAEDLAKHNYDLKRTMRLIATSRAYRLQAHGSQPAGPRAVGSHHARVPGFEGPLIKRLSAEQFVDAVASITGHWPKPTRRMLKRDGRGQGGQLAAVSPLLKTKPKTTSKMRCVFLDTGPLLKALGRPIREQVVTRRDSVATTLQFLELTNGQTLDAKLKAGAKTWLSEYGENRDDLVKRLYRTALSREPTAKELKVARDILGEKPTAEDVQDLLWIVLMLPEFQLVR